VRKIISNILLGSDILNFIRYFCLAYCLIGIISLTLLGIICINEREEQKDKRKKKDNEKKNNKKKELVDKLDISKKIDCLKHLSKIQISQFDERRRIEWKLLFAILIFYFGIITAKITSTNTNSIDDIQKFILLLTFFIIAAFAIFYLTYIHLANHKNKSFAHNSGDAIRDLLIDKVPNFNIFEFKSVVIILENWSFKMQILLLFSMAFCSSIIIWI